MKTPLISVIIPTYNRAQIIVKSLDSLLAQTYNNWECLVIDDGSSDNTSDILQRYRDRDPRFKFYKRDRQPKGAPTCRNIGIDHTKGDYIIFLDSDDYLMPFCMENRILKVNQYPDHDFLVFPMGEKQGSKIMKKEIVTDKDYLVEFLSAQILWQTMCPIWKRATLIQLNGFTEGYPRFNDPELMIRALVGNNVKFRVLSDMNYDSVHLPSAKSDVQFKNNVYKSLIMFVPDISAALVLNKKKDYRPYLSYYLHYWFKYVYIESGSSEIVQSIRLIFICWTNKIISLKRVASLFVRVLLYAFGKYFFNNPIEKLSEKRIYS